MQIGHCLHSSKCKEARPGKCLFVFCGANPQAAQAVTDRSFIRSRGVGWCKWGGVIPFCAPENGGLHKIVQPFLWVMYHFVQSTFLSTSNQISDITNPIQRGCSFGICARNRMWTTANALDPSEKGRIGSHTNISACTTGKVMGCNQEYLKLLAAIAQWFNIDHLRCPKFCCNILKTTDAGPKVGVTNIEMCFGFRDVEIARIQ